MTYLYFYLSIKQILYIICLLYWSIAITIYLGRVYLKSFQDFTSYGKLSSNLQKNNKKKRIEPSSSSSSLSYYIDREWIETKNGWLTFYLISMLLSLISILGQSNFKYTFGQDEKEGSSSSSLSSSSQQQLYLFYLLMFIQASRRLFETLFVQKHSRSRMNNLLFISGVSYYLFITLSPCFSTPYTFNLGSFNFIPFIIFAIASYSQRQVHIILSNIRNIPSVIITSSSQSMDKHYEIPKGFLFNYISCPHFLMEIIIYTCFFLIVPSLPFLMALIFTSLNLIHRSIETHRWYQKQFKDYPKSRKIIVPFIY
ncbi:hypothetical protein DFA_07066 [Cavenderia fasciculata]|uniref:3-oxo-5-alpha-steroid 4-dehydrogenase C-terminal domain-containing protein n=1 Tax=Cavenderia fasciculata TaxID=261658 RepID=F4PVE1_CACFS|nr:uncharacterized protein DFA_07066 [Cavenderia fasciculata]EGG19955.1 hypothetical protein DFA_07066 [Cavenderia fasciculata]|eukprot:XP_004366938.1 hypothetical protein DFA_07066 [Cavenderia fasciculata]